MTNLIRGAVGAKGPGAKPLDFMPFAERPTPNAAAAIRAAFAHKVVRKEKPALPPPPPPLSSE